MKKAVLINYLGRKGGGALYAYEMTKALTEMNCDVYVILPKNIDNLNSWKALNLKELYLVDTYSNTITFIINTIIFKLFRIKLLKKHYANIKIDNVYVPMIQPWTYFVNKIFTRSHTIVTLHDPKPHQGFSSFLNRFYEKAVKEADDVVILSRKFVDYTCETYNKRKDQVHVIPHGIFGFYSKYSFDNGISRNNQINFLFFGRITEYKGLHLLANAYRRLYDVNPNISLVVAGSGNFSQYREAYSQLKNVTIVNEFIPDDQVSSYFRGNNIVTVLPYTDATQSGVIPIAMKENSLLLVSNTGALREQTDDGRCAVLFEPTEEALFDAMLNVLNNFDCYKYVIAEANEYVNSLSWDKLANDLFILMQ